ncbi:MAG: thiamine diphosphokinase [Clostridia bacterium]|nr:thiamine diphosphokinase [Clostridia bacterium]
MKRAVIFCSGDMDTDEVWLPEYRDALILCADGGYRHAERLGVVPDLIIGDLDSGVSQYPAGIASRIYPSEKDATDTNLCLDYAIGQGCNEVLIFGGLGGRLDHEFSHYALLLYGLRRGVKVRLVNKDNEIWMERKPFVLEPSEKKYVSFFPYGGDVEEFTVEGLKYEVESMTLRCDLVQASSNQFENSDKATVSFRDGGVLLVMRCRDPKEKLPNK